MGYKRMTALLVGMAVIFPLLPDTDVLALKTHELREQQQGSGDGAPPLAPDEIAFLDGLDHLENDDVEAAYAVLEASFVSSARHPDPQKRFNRLSQRKISLGGGTTFTSEYKIRQDIEQAQYLAQTLSHEDPQKADFFRSIVLPVYEQLLSRIPPLEELNDTMGLYKFQRSDVDYGIMNFYNRALHIPDVPATRPDGTPIPIFSKSLNQRKIQKDWVHSNGIVVVDNVLSKEALELIQRKILWESTVWYQTKLPQRFGGYTGAYIDDGLHQRILLQLSVDLRKLLPDIFEGHPLKYMWAYKCEFWISRRVLLCFFMAFPDDSFAQHCCLFKQTIRTLGESTYTLTRQPSMSTYG